MGAGRSVIDEELDYGAGIVLLKKTGDYITEGEPLAEFYTNRGNIPLRSEEFYQTITVAQEPPGDKLPLIYEVIE